MDSHEHPSLTRQTKYDAGEGGGGVEDHVLLLYCADYVWFGAACACILMLVVVDFMSRAHYYIRSPDNIRLIKSPDRRN
jgi:hypothetical protein